MKKQNSMVGNLGPALDPSALILEYDSNVDPVRVHLTTKHSAEQGNRDI